MNQKRSIIFGGTGFIGSALASELVSCGEKVVSISRHIPREKQSGVEYFSFDIETDSEKISEVCRGGDAIFFLTGQVYPHFDSEKEKNTFGKLLDAVNKTSPAKVIFTSSALVYGDSEKPANENSALNPKDEYSVFKIECEKMIQEKLSGIPVGILRLANVYGSEKNRGFVGLVFEKMLEGSDMKVNSDGLQKRDYIFLDEVVSALIAISGGLQDSDIVNVATGESSTLLDVIHLIEEASGEKISYEITGTPVNEVNISRIDATKLKEKYGFEARVSLAEGLRKTWDRYNKKD